MSKKLEALAATMQQCYDSRSSFMNEFAYHYGRTGQDTIYTDGCDYYAIGKRTPTWVVGKPWEPHPDQFWAHKLDMTVWVSKQDTGATA
jgi:hypothetical protein